jgi:ABC-type multidrug transport system fused ATPase/permease subunit
MLFVFAMVLDVIAMKYQESSRDWYFNKIRRSRATVARSKDEEDKSGESKLDENDTEAQVKSGDVSMEPESLAVSNLSYAVNIGKTKTCWKPRRATWGSLLGPALAKIAGKSLQSSQARAEEEEETPVTELTLLNEVTARFKCGRMTALMGQSGAGKTTLLVSRVSSLVFELFMYLQDF